MTSSRPNQQSWVTAFANAPPAACATLRALSNTVEYGVQCVFAEEDGDPLPNSINAACLPWATNSLPSSAAFYSPATACPTSWAAVATRTAAEGASDWVNGETALECCPPGFVGGTGGLCNPGTSGWTPVVICGEADANENENAMYLAGSWPVTLNARVTALQLRYQASDTGGTASVTGSGTLGTGTSTGTSSAGNGNGNGNGGLSTGVKAAIGTVIPLVFILGALAAFLLWRRRKHRMADAALSNDFADGHETKQSYKTVPQESFDNSNAGSKSMADVGVAAAAVAPRAANAAQIDQRETPEWNAELDATEAERRRYMAVHGSLFPPGSQAEAPSPGAASEASELGGIMRVNRKPVMPVELDSTPVTMELDGSGSVGRR